MYVITNKLLRWWIIPLVLLLLWGYKTYNILSINSDVTRLEYAGKKTDVQPWSGKKLLKGDKRIITISSSANLLGTVSVRFDTFGKINSDVVRFRIKEEGQQQWYYQNDYKVNQFPTNGLFPFGFPVIENSDNKTYVIEIESLLGNGKNSIALSNIEPVFVLEHKYTKDLLLHNKSVLAYFIYKKILNTGLQIDFLLNALVFFIPFIVYLLFQKFYGEKLDKFLMKQKKRFNKVDKKLLIDSFNQKLDNFFLLNQNRNFPAFDGLRAWAVIMVVMAHTTAPLGRLTNYLEANQLANFFYDVIRVFPFIGAEGGTMGVDLFFMLSGFLIFMSIIHKKKITIKQFLYLRMARLLPAHIAVVLPLLIGLPIIGIVLNIFFIVELFPRYTNANVLTWTMTYEMLFYIFIALWLIKGKNKPFLHTWKFLFLVAIALYLSQDIISIIFKLFDMKYIQISRFLAFFFGVALAKLYFGPKRLWKKATRIFSYSIIPSLILITIFRYAWLAIEFERKLGDIGIVLLYLLLDIGLFLLLGSMLVHKDNFIQKIFSNRYLRIIGVVSYSLYLNHLMWGIKMAEGIVAAIPDATIKTILFVLLTFLISFVIAVFLFHYLEKPYFLRKKPV